MEISEAGLEVGYARPAGVLELPARETFLMYLSRT